MADVLEAGPARVVNLRDIEWVAARYPDEDFDRGAYRDIGGVLGSRAIGANVHRLAPGEENARYHAHEIEEELFFILKGRPTLRLDGREFRLGGGHVVHCPPLSAHTFLNESDGECRILMCSNRCGRPDAVYPSWKREERDAGENTSLDPLDPRVRHSAELGWEDDPHGRVWGGWRDLTSRMGLQVISSRIRILRPGALVPYRSFPSSEGLHLVLDGEMEALIAGQPLTLREWDAVHVPARTPHAFRLRRRRQARLFSLLDGSPEDETESAEAPEGWDKPIRL